MPQTSPEVRAAIVRLFGPDDTKQMMHDVSAEVFLKRRGWQLSPRWSWRMPSPDHEPDEDELLCVQYLIEEWDFGGIDG
jgi:hypothetical protein